MDKEASKKVRMHNHPKLEQSLGLDKDHVIIDREAYNTMVHQFGTNYFNYRKPKEKPPLLSDEEIIEIEFPQSDGDIEFYKKTHNYQFGYKVAQAQWDICVKHYEGIDD